MHAGIYSFDEFEYKEIEIEVRLHAVLTLALTLTLTLTLTLASCNLLQLWRVLAYDVSLTHRPS